MPNFIRMVFYKNNAINGSISGSIGSPISGSIDTQIYLTERQKDIIDLIRQNPKVSYRKMAQILDIADSAVKKHLNKLKEMGVIERVGGTRGYWRIID